MNYKKLWEEAVKILKKTLPEHAYEAWIETYNKGNLLVIDVDKLDFVKNKSDLNFIIEKIDKKIN